MRVILYQRVSSAEQAEHGISLDAQADKLTAYAKLFDLEVVATIRDAGESAKSLNRPGIQEALAMLDRGEADGIAVVKLDRLTRNVGDWQRLVARYFSEKAGKQLWSVQDHIDTTTAMGRLIVNITLSVSQWERETTGERTKEALAHKIRNRKRVGKVLYGFDLAADGESLIPNAAEQSAIALMEEMQAAGRTLRAIAGELSSRGIATKIGLSTWSHQAVARILHGSRVAA